MLWRATESLLYLSAPPRKLGTRNIGIAHFINDIVDLATERIDGDDRAPIRWR